MLHMESKWRQVCMVFIVLILLRFRAVRIRSDFRFRIFSGRERKCPLRSGRKQNVERGQK